MSGESASALTPNCLQSCSVLGNNTDPSNDNKTKRHVTVLQFEPDQSPGTNANDLAHY